MATRSLGFSLMGVADTGTWTQRWTKLNAVDSLR